MSSRHLLFPPARGFLYICNSIRAPSVVWHRVQAIFEIQYAQLRQHKPKHNPATNSCKDECVSDLAHPKQQPTLASIQLSHLQQVRNVTQPLQTQQSRGTGHFSLKSPLVNLGSQACGKGQYKERKMHLTFLKAFMSSHPTGNSCPSLQSAMPPLGRLEL